MHRLYLQTPPHDTLLYDILQVSPNATLYEITKSYRKLTRQLHPDKTDNDAEQEQLERVRHAFDVLKDDSTRLPYHKYGLLTMSQAVRILLGSATVSSDDDDPRMERLLLLMGYSRGATSSHSSSSSTTDNDTRIWLIASQLIETIRPVIEGVLDEAVLLDAIAQECDQLKGLAMGAQILRCVGRAYRYSGQTFLQQRQQQQGRVLAVPQQVRDKWRDVKHLATAAMASGRVVLSEQLSGKRQRRPSSKNRMAAIKYDDPFEGPIGEIIDNDDDVVMTEEQIKQQEHLKAQTAMLESLQVEALWKITKIDLDRTVRQACDLILKGEYFFYPSHHPARRAGMTTNRPEPDGWVGDSGMAINAQQAQLRAAEILIHMGNVMVRRSKEGTAWME